MSELARPFKMALPSFAQHLNVMERSGLVKSRKCGRVRTYRIVPSSLESAQRWLDGQRANWEARFNQLDTYLTDLKENDADG